MKKKITDKKAIIFDFDDTLAKQDTVEIWG